MATPLTGPVDRTKRQGWFESDPVKAGEIIFKGAAVCLDAAGDAVNATAAAGLITRGICKTTVDNTNDGENVETEVGYFEFDMLEGDEITQAEVGDLCYWDDNHTVCKTGTGKSVAGVIRSVRGNKVTVGISLYPFPPAAPVGP